MSDSYEDILNMTWEDVPEAVTLPVGPYRVKGKFLSYRAAADEGQNDRFSLSFVVQGPLEGVDEDALAQLGEDYDFAANQVEKTVWIENRASWGEVAKTLRTVGVEPSGSIFEQDGKVSKALQRAFRGVEVGAHLGERTYEKDGEMRTTNTLSKFIAL
jgi:hypothetical protein